MDITLNILVLVCWALAAICNAVMDTLTHHYDTSIFKNMKKQKWWNPAVSWTNKYTDIVSYKKPRYFGSTTFLVWTTDAWHFFQFMMLNFVILSGVIMMNCVTDVLWWENIIIFALLKVVWGVCFELFYKKAFIK